MEEEGLGKREQASLDMAHKGAGAEAEPPDAAAEGKKDILHSLVGIVIGLCQAGGEELWRMQVRRKRVTSKRRRWRRRRR